MGFMVSWHHPLPGVTEGSNRTTAAGKVIKTAMLTQWTRNPTRSLKEP